MNDKNELNDIILNKSTNNNSNKKIILAVATLGVILIVVVMLMNSLSSNGTDNLPQALLPQEPQGEVVQAQEEPLFEEVEVVMEEPSSDINLELITQKLKEESQAELSQEVIHNEVIPKHKKQTLTKPVIAKVVTKKVTPVHKASTITYYIQVGSFSKYQPNKKFLNSITQLGYKYKFHKVASLNKVLVGPFKNSTEAKNARRILRSKVEPGSFLVKL
ncbi:SPOR domain-containing protein [Sulfurimonas sp. SAG-AH-194-L11]|nr:SPOR domain-containing protein [Sulfurimonas sp. SAG-AH-194-L11]MDF1877153.1 SPOR domain-containing protein [Sulfurimonas sp. SAG-AH-194-L11]